MYGPMIPRHSTVRAQEIRPPSRQGPAPPLLRRQRRLPLPGARLRRPALRPPRRPRRRLAADRLGGADLRALAAPVAGLPAARAPRPAPPRPVGRGAGG